MQAESDARRTVYYLPGRGGRLSAGLGQGLLDRGLNVTGRETVGDFRSLPFMDQVKAVADDLQTYFWSPGGRVVANSFGAYLFLHAQAQLPPYPGRVLLLSPIIGEFEDSDTQRVFSPPYADPLKTLALSGEFPTPTNAQIHVGELDWQSGPGAVVAFGRLVGIPVTVVPDAGHVLGKDYVGKLLDWWFGGRRAHVGACI